MAHDEYKNDELFKYLKKERANHHKRVYNIMGVGARS